MESDGISALPGCYLLVILGEPLSDNHNEKILQRVAKGLLSWNTESTQCDLKHLEHVCDNFKIEKQETFETEILLQHSTERLAVEVLFNPHIFTFKQCLRNLLLSPTGHKHIIYAGYSFSGSGSWIMQDGVFRFNDFLDELSDPSVLKVLSLNTNGSKGEMHLHCHPIGDWVINKLDDQPFSHLLNLSLNPVDSPNGVPGASHLLDFIESSLSTLSKKDHLESSSLTGNIKFERPTMYIFPSGQGDCSLLGITGFTMLIDGGFPRFPCFWKFIRHIETLDTIMITRINESNIWGILSLLKGKQECFMYPKIGYVFCNIGESGDDGSSAKEGNITSIQSDKSDLIISLIDMGKEIASSLKQINCNPHQCIRESPLNPLILYQKVGHGTLEMYVLNPAQESKLLKEFLSHWSSNKDSLPVVRSRSALQNKEKSDQDIAIPVSDLMSICCLVIWKPSDPLDRITRILFPGSAPQNQIMEGLSMLKGLELLNSRVCTKASLENQSKQKATSRTSVKKSETSVPSTRYRSVSPTYRKSYTKHVANDHLDKGKIESQSSAIKKKVNISSTQKEDNSSKKADELPIEKSTLDKKTPRGITGRKIKSKTDSTATTTIVSESSEVTSDSSEKQINSVRQVRIRSADKSKEAKKVKKVHTQESKEENTDDCSSNDKKSETSHEVNYNEENHPDSGKGSVDASPRKFPFHLRDDIEPDSLESCEIYGNVEISQDSLEHSEDGAITCDSQSISQLDQVTSLDDNEMKSWSSPTHLNHEPQSMMLSSLSSNVSEMTMVSGARKESQSDLEVTSLNLRIENDQTSSAIDTSLVEENCKSDDTKVINDSQSPPQSDSDLHKDESINIKNEESLEIEDGTKHGIVDSHISQLEFAKENQLTDDSVVDLPQTNLSQELREGQTDEVVAKPEASKRLSIGVELSKDDSESLEINENTIIEAHPKDEMATDGNKLAETNEVNDASDGNSEKLSEIIQGNQNAVIVDMEDKSLSDTKSAESLTAMPEEKDTKGDSKIVINEGSIEETMNEQTNKSMVLESEIENCDNGAKENSTLNGQLEADEKVQENDKFEHSAHGLKVLISELDEKTETHDDKESGENEEKVKISDLMNAAVEEANCTQIIEENEKTDDVATIQSKLSADEVVQEAKTEFELEDSSTVIPGEKETVDSKSVLNESSIEETTQQEIQGVDLSLVKDQENCDKILAHKEAENDTSKEELKANEILPDKLEIEHSALASKVTCSIDEMTVKTERLDKLEATENLRNSEVSDSINGDLNKQKFSSPEMSEKVNDASSADEIDIKDEIHHEIEEATTQLLSTEEKVKNDRRESTKEESKVTVCEMESSSSKQLFKLESEGHKMDAVDKFVDDPEKGDHDKSSVLLFVDKKESSDEDLEQKNKSTKIEKDSGDLVCNTIEKQNVDQVATFDTSDQKTVEKVTIESSTTKSEVLSLTEKRKMSSQKDENEEKLTSTEEIAAIEKSVEIERKPSTHEKAEKTNMNENNAAMVKEVAAKDSNQQVASIEENFEKIMATDSKLESTLAVDVITLDKVEIIGAATNESEPKSPPANDLKKTGADTKQSVKIEVKEIQDKDEKKEEKHNDDTVKETVDKIEERCETVQITKESEDKCTNEPIKSAQSNDANSSEFEDEIITKLKTESGEKKESKVEISEENEKCEISELGKVKETGENAETTKEKETQDCDIQLNEKQKDSTVKETIEIVSMIEQSEIHSPSEESVILSKRMSVQLDEATKSKSEEVKITDGIKFSNQVEKIESDLEKRISGDGGTEIADKEQFEGKSHTSKSIEQLESQQTSDIAETHTDLKEIHSHSDKNDKNGGVAVTVETIEKLETKENLKTIEITNVISSDVDAEICSPAIKVNEKSSPGDTTQSTPSEDMMKLEDKISSNIEKSSSVTLEETGTSKMVLNESSIIDETDQQKIVFMGSEKEMKNCDIEEKEKDNNETLNRKSSVDVKMQENGAIEHSTLESKIICETMNKSEKTEIFEKLESTEVHEKTSATREINEKENITTNAQSASTDEKVQITRRESTIDESKVIVCEKESSKSNQMFTLSLDLKTESGEKIIDDSVNETNIEFPVLPVADKQGIDDLEQKNTSVKNAEDSGSNTHDLDKVASCTTSDENTMILEKVGTQSSSSSSAISWNSSGTGEKRRISNQKDENEEKSATSFKEVKKSEEAKRKSVTHEVAELQQIHQTTKESEVTVSEEKLKQSEVQFDFERKDVVNIEINEFEIIGAATNESEPKSPSANDPKKTDADTKQSVKIEVKEIQDKDEKKEEKLNVDTIKETSAVDKMVERYETVQITKESEISNPSETTQFELKTSANIDNGPELKDKINLQSKSGDVESDKYELENGKLKKTESSKVVITDETLAPIEEKDVSDCDIEVDEKQKTNKLYETSTSADVIKHADSLEKSTKGTNSLKEIESASSINILQNENNVPSKLEAEVGGVTQVHILRSTQLVRQNLYQIPDEEETVESPFEEKKQIDLSHEKTKSIEYPEVLHITESTTTSPSETTRNQFVGTQEIMETAGTSSMTTIITSPESTQSRLCCFPVSIEENTNEKEKKTKEIANEPESFDTFNSQNLTEQQIKCKEATLKEWGNPLGLPKPPSSVYKTPQTTTKSRAKSSDRNEHLKHSTRRTGLGSDSIKPIYLDLAYIPNHGDRHYCNAEYFKKVRARYYVLSGVNPSKEVLDALITGKQSWPDKETETTLIPSHESEALCLWMATNQKTLEILNIDVAPSASRCSVILQGQESSCSAYRVEF